MTHEKLIRGNAGKVYDFLINLFFSFEEALKADYHLPKNCVICFIESPIKIMKNAFYFILKALKKDKVNLKVHDVTSWLTNNYNTHIAQYLTK